MPDWSYHPFFRPLLFKLPPLLARDLALSSLGLLASLPLGYLIIETMGHMRLPAGIERSIWGISFPSPVGLSAGLDVNAVAHDRAGFGGALISDGLGILLLALWGFRRGARWAWWTLLGAGISEFVATVVIHLTVGYTNVWHLAPTFLVAFPYTLGLINPRRKTPCLSTGGMRHVLCLGLG